jgi:hypothetical protein
MLSVDSLEGEFMPALFASPAAILAFAITACVLLLMGGKL